MRLADDVVVAKLDDGWVAFRGGEEELFELNEVAGLVLWLVQEGRKEVNAIVEEIVSRFEVEFGQALVDVNDFLDYAHGEGLIEY